MQTKLIRLYEVGIYAIRSFSYLLITFLILIYFIQKLPLKVKIYKLMNAESFKLRSLFVFFNDKTLCFALFYAIFISLSFYHLAFCSILMIDYFFRFKLSSRITFMVLKSGFKIMYVIVLVIVIVYMGALVNMDLNIFPSKCIDVSSCTQE